MSLFIGNVSKKVTLQEFEDAFKSYGSCKIDLRKRYAFVQYDSERCAEEAKNNLQNVNFSGLRLNIEWSKNSGRFNQNKGSKMMPERGRRRRSNSKEHNWRREDKHFRRSPSYDRRTNPTYSDNEEDIKTFQPKCPRDQVLFDKLKSVLEEKVKKAESRQMRSEEKEMEEKEKQENIEGDIEREAMEEERELQAGEAI